jgi:hypothetical protein
LKLDLNHLPTFHFVLQVEVANGCCKQPETPTEHENPDKKICTFKTIRILTDRSDSPAMWDLEIIKKSRNMLMTAS